MDTTYETHLKQFDDLQVWVVKHDTSPTGYPLYIEMHLNKLPRLKDRGALCLDAGNYLYRKFGVAFEPMPEFRGKGKATTLRWFVSWDKGQSLIEAIKNKYGCKIKASNYLPLEFTRLSIGTNRR